MAKIYYSTTRRGGVFRSLSTSICLCAITLAFMCVVKATHIAIVQNGAPCDIYDRSGTPCVAAHSLVRALYKKYNGPLYLVRRGEDNATKEINTISPGGVADSQMQDEFCRSSNHCPIFGSGPGASRAKAGACPSVA